MREYIPSSKTIERYGISRWRFRELKAKFAQYQEFKRKADSLLGVQGNGISDMPKSGGISSSVESAAIRREILIAKMRILEEAIKRAADGKELIERALFDNLCRGKGYEKIRAVKSCVVKSEFYAARWRAMHYLDLLLDCPTAEHFK